MDRAAKAETFRALHEGDPFVFPNPWDAGSARLLQSLGFKALATTSSGFAFALGKRDGEPTLDELVDHVRAVADATDVPVAVDLENGYGPAPEDVADAIRRIAEAGAVGGSIEDWDRDGERLYERGEALERLSAAIAAARELDFPFTLTARAEVMLRDPDLDETIARLQAYEEAGADVIFAPGLRELDQVRAVREATSKPLNVLGRPGFTVQQLFEAGAQRISVGGSLTYVAMTALADAAERIRDEGDLDVLRIEPKRIGGWLSG